MECLFSVLHRFLSLLCVCVWRRALLYCKCNEQSSLHLCPGQKQRASIQIPHERGESAYSRVTIRYTKQWRGKGWNLSIVALSRMSRSRLEEVPKSRPDILFPRPFRSSSAGVTQLEQLERDGCDTQGVVVVESRCCFSSCSLGHASAAEKRTHTSRTKIVQKPAAVFTYVRRHARTARVSRSKHSSL